ncbi:hypothetical protein FGB62_13g032 [Gracilaria domingensis]|nr:hypothetical protein FGB62_13g032 [Gracilaria domingensis]
MIVPMTPTVPPANAAVSSFTVGPITTPLRLSRNTKPVPTEVGSTAMEGAALVELCRRRQQREWRALHGAGSRLMCAGAAKDGVGTWVGAIAVTEKRCHIGATRFACGGDDTVFVWGGAAGEWSCAHVAVHPRRFRCADSLGRIGTLQTAQPTRRRQACSAHAIRHGRRATANHGAPGAAGSATTADTRAICAQRVRSGAGWVTCGAPRFKRGPIWAVV